MRELTRSSPNATFVAFASLWAVAHLLDAVEAEPSGWALVPRVVVGLAAIAVLARPTPARLGSLAAAQVIGFVLLAPPTSNHSLLLVVVNAALVVELVRGWRGPALPAGWASLARTALLVGYVAAAVSKLNRGFFDPVISCANELATTASFGAIDTASPALPWIVAGMELSIAALLLAPRTRSLGVRVGLSFHFLVGLSPLASVRDFTATLFAAFALFLTEEETQRAITRARRLTAQTPVLRAVLDHPRVNTILAVVVLVVLLVTGGGLALLSGWLLFNVLAVVVLAAVWSVGLGPGTVGLGRPPLVHLPLLAVLGVIVAGPYLGLGTAPAFTPFSNLRTEGVGTNHFFLPSVHPTDHQTEVLWLDGANRLEIQELADDGFGLTHATLRYLGTQDPTLEVSGVDHQTGATVTDRPAPSFGDPSVPERYLLGFRPVPGPTAPRCSA